MTYEYVRNYFKEKGCELLENNYVDAKTIMRYLCVCGQESQINWNNFQQGQKCKKCGFKKAAASRKLDYTIMKESFEEKGCKLLSEFVNSQTKIQFKCSCGNICETYYHSFKNGKGCKYCKSLKLSGNKNHKWIDDRNEVKFRKMFRVKCYSLVRNVLNSLDFSKTQSTNKILGYTANELRNRIFEHENWKNINGPWDLDHIYPIKAFVDYGITDLKIINCLDNLMPLCRTKNRSKNCSYDKNNFENWLKSKNYNF